MSRLLELLSLAPVLRGFAALIVSGASFPLCGVLVLRLDLVPLRYMLMHGVILGGAVALASQLPPVPVIAAVNVALVLVMLVFGRGAKNGLGGASAAVMVLSIALASVITHLCGVPAKDTLSLLWGSPFALTAGDMAMLCAIACALVLFVVLDWRNIMPLFFDADIATSLGMNVRRHYAAVVLLVALVVAVAMRLLGAFLIDALLILPVLCASAVQSLAHRAGIRPLVCLSSAAGLAFSLAGYAIALMLDLPPGATIALLAGVAYAALIAAQKLRPASHRGSASRDSE